MRKGEDKYNQNGETCARVVPVSHSRGGHKQGQAVIIFVGDLPDKTSDTFEKFQRIFSLCWHTIQRESLLVDRAYYSIFPVGLILMSSAPIPSLPDA